jgi:hypothetical protein
LPLQGFTYIRLPLCRGYDAISASQACRELLRRDSRLVVQDSYSRSRGFIFCAVMPAAVRDAIQPGSSVDRYQIVGLLSAGGMGGLPRHRRALGRELVLKVLSNEADFRAELLERFIREARAESALNHPTSSPST